LLGSQHGWHDNCRLASEGRQRPKKGKKRKKKEISNLGQTNYLVIKFVIFLIKMKQPLVLFVVE